MVRKNIPEKIMDSRYVLNKKPLEPADVPKGRRGATLCKFTTYSAGRYDGIPRTCSRLRGKQARANELIAKGDGYTFIAAPRSPDLRHTEKRRRHLCYCGNE